jgi:DNA-binding transcriptional MerR regulator
VVMWSVGQLSRATGVTVRALHHYDEIGLLAPSPRTDAGHRRYSDDDLPRLYRIVALRSLGLGLLEIADALSDGGDLLAARTTPARAA